MLFAFMDAFDILLEERTFVFQQLFHALYEAEDFKIRLVTNPFPAFPGIVLYGAWDTLKGTVGFHPCRQAV